MKDLTFVAHYVRCAITKKHVLEGSADLGAGCGPSYLPMHSWGPRRGGQLGMIVVQNNVSHTCR